MSKGKFCLQLNPRHKQIQIEFDTLKQREDFLLLLNKVQFNASISLYRSNESEEK